MDVSPAKRSYFTCANVWWKLLFHSTYFFANPLKSRALKKSDSKKELGFFIISIIIEI